MEQNIKEFHLVDGDIFSVTHKTHKILKGRTEFVLREKYWAFPLIYIYKLKKWKYLSFKHLFPMRMYRYEYRERGDAINEDK